MLLKEGHGCDRDEEVAVVGADASLQGEVCVVDDKNTTAWREDELVATVGDYASAGDEIKLGGRQAIALGDFRETDHRLVGLHWGAEESRCRKSR